MDVKSFLKGVLSGEGHYCVFASRTSDDRRTQKFYDSIYQVIDAAENLDAEGYDAYYALATFNEAGSRKVDNVKHLNALFLDLDCGASKDYATQADAISALRAFCGKLSLPKPVMVNSGRGVHVYWMLDAPVCLDDWLPVAERLKKLCADHGLLADPAVTADAARVLRIPTTHNHKDSPPTPVEFLFADTTNIVNFDSFSELLGNDPVSIPKKYVPETNSAFRDALNSNVESTFREIIRKTQEKRGCQHLKHILKNQEECSEPMWRAGLSIAKFCTASHDAIHAISKNHADYTAHDTQKKVDLIKGPYLCNTFDEYESGVCSECPHWGKIKSPISLGMRVLEAEESENVFEGADEEHVIPTYPRPYFRGLNGGIYVRTTNSDGDPDEKLIYHNDLYVVRRIRDVELGESVVMRLHLPQDKAREFTLPLTAVTSREEFRKNMSMQGVAVTKMDELMSYTTTWVNELQATGTADEAHRQFGWTDKDGTSFVLGDKLIYKDRVESNPSSIQTAGLFPAFKTRGTYDEWIKLMDFYNRDGFELHQFVVGTSFGSVLMNFSPINCGTLHLDGGSGVGKTTAMYAGLSLWGSPEVLLTDNNDTVNTRMHRREIYHNLPLYMDELTNALAKELSNLAYQLTSGKQRGRMASGSNTERHRGEPWNLLAVTSANLSVVEKINTVKAIPEAEAQRILECRVKSLKHMFLDKAETDKYQDDIKKCFGHGGVKYVQYIMNNLEDVKKLLLSVQSKVDRKAKLEAPNRFWSILVASTITGLILAKRLGMVSYDVQKVFKWGIDVVEQNKRKLDDMSVGVEELLNDYIHEHWSNVLWIKSTDDLRKNEAESLVIPEALPRGKLVARYETDLKRAYLIPKPLKSWCGDHQVNYNSLLNDLKEKLNARRTKMRLSKGTHMNLPPTDVIIVDCSIDVLDGPKDAEGT